MKTKNRIMRSLMSLAIAFVAVAMLGGVNAQAKSLYKYDSKKGVVWRPAVRVSVGSPSYVGQSYNYGTTPTGYKNKLHFSNSYDISVYTKDKTTVTATSSSPDLLVKTTYNYGYTTKDSYMTVYNTTSWYDSKGKQHHIESLKDKEFRSQIGVDVFAKEAGTYTVTLKIKKGKKTIATKKVKVYAVDYGPIKSIKYGNDKYYDNISFVTNKKSGKLKITMNKTYKLKKIEVGGVKDLKGETYDWSLDSENLNLKTFKNGRKLTLSQKKKFSITDSYGTDSQSVRDVDYIFPVTGVKVTYVDTLFGTEGYSMFYITYKK